MSFHHKICKISKLDDLEKGAAEYELPESSEQDITEDSDSGSASDEHPLLETATKSEYAESSEQDFGEEDVPRSTENEKPL